MINYHYSHKAFHRNVQKSFVKYWHINNLTDYIKVDCNSNIGDTVHINMKLCFYNTCKMANDTMFCSETRIVTNAYDPNNKIAFVNDKENNNSYKQVKN